MSGAMTRYDHFERDQIAIPGHVTASSGKYDRGVIDALGLPPRLVTPPLSPPFVGRSAELDRLDGIWDAVVGGERQVALVAGEPGAGKTRLVAEAASAAHAAGAAVLHGICTTGHREPLGAIADAVSPLLATGDGALANGVPAPTGRLGRLSLDLGRTLGPEASGAANQRELFAAVLVLLREAWSEQPLVLVVDDLHWADQASLEFLVHLARTTRAEPLLVLATVRTTLPERTTELMIVLSEIYRAPGIHRLDLDGLDTAEIAQYLDLTVHGDAAAMRQAAAMLRDRTGGNPFFLHQAVSGMESASAADVIKAQKSLPGTVVDAVSARLDGYNKAQREILGLVGIAGSEIAAGVLADASGSQLDLVEATLNSATQRGLLRTTTPGLFSFAHDLGREAVVGLVAPTRLPHMHARIADALARSEPDTGRVAGRLAFHYTQAANIGRRSDAIESHLMAAGLARRRLAFGDSAHSLEAAADLAGAEQAAALLVDAGDDHVRAGDNRAARRVYATAVESPDADVVVRAAVGFEDACWKPGLLGHEAVALLLEAQRRIEGTTDTALQINVLSSLGRALAFAGAAEQALRVSDEALERAEQHQDDRLLALALHRSLTTGAGRGPTTDHFHRATRAMDLAVALDDPDLLGQIGTQLSCIAYALGDHTAHLRGHTLLSEGSRRSPQPWHRFSFETAAAARLFMAGKFADTARAIEQLDDSRGAFDDSFADGMLGFQAFMLNRETGVIDEIRPLITGDPDTEPGDWDLGLIAIYTELGMVQPLRHVLNTVMTDDFIKNAPSLYQGEHVAFLAEAIVATADPERARTFYDKLLIRSGTNLVSGPLIAVFGSADRFLAMLAATFGGPARDHFRLALDMDTEMGSRTHEAETAARFARYLESTSTAPDLARELRHRAEKIAKTIGSARTLKILEPKRSTRANATLTRREREVLELIALGLSNHEIAERLFIAKNTAANHVRNILVKTGARNRTEAAMLAAQRGYLNK